MVIRSHEVKDEGYEVDHNEKLVTVFSAPNYCDQVGLLTPSRVSARAGLAGLRQWIFWSRQWIFWTYYVTYNVLTLRCVHTPKNPKNPHKTPKVPKNPKCVSPAGCLGGRFRQRAYRPASGSDPHASGFFRLTETLVTTLINL